MESGPLLPCGVPGRGAPAWLADELAVPSGALDWSVWIVTVRIFFGAGAAGVAGATVETDGMAGDGETWPALGFDAVVVGIAGAGGAGGVDIAGLLDAGPPE
jgi:hypothetical protein